MTRNRMGQAAVVALVWLLGATPAHSRVIDGVVALVNGEPITFSEVREEVSDGMGIPVGDADAYLREERDLPAVLRWIDGIVESVLVRTELTKRGQAVGESEVDRAVESVRKANGVNEEQFTEILAREGLTPASYRRRIRWQLERGAIVRARKYKEVSVTEDEVRDYYRENAERFLEGAQVRLATLFLPLGTAGSAEEQAARARFAAQQASEAARAGRTIREAFDVAQGTYPEAKLITGDFLPSADLLPEVRREVGRLRSGEISPPFFTQEGVYLVQVIERRGGKPEEFSKVKDALTDELTDRRSEKAFAEILQDLKKAASIDVRL